MQIAIENPPGNKLKTGVDEAQVAAAVKRSGYPLQTVVAAQLKERFRIREEWSYIDDDSQALRTLDLLAERRLYELTMEPQPRVRPTLDLLIECKQSELPYIFFVSEATVSPSHFPVVAGLFGDKIEITTDDSPSTWSYPVVHALSLDAHSFLSSAPTRCTSFSKCVRKGADLELSGSEPYQGLVLPLVKALRHFQSHECPPTTAFYHDLHLAFAVAVLDAPMMAVTIKGDNQEIALVPWVRVFRHESVDSDKRHERSQTFAIDVVHKEYLTSYLEKHLEPFAREFSEKGLRHATEIATGRAFATGMDKHWGREVEQRLRPRPMAAKTHRFIVIVTHLVRRMRLLFRS